MTTMLHMTSYKEGYRCKALLLTGSYQVFEPLGEMLQDWSGFMSSVPEKSDESCWPRVGREARAVIGPKGLVLRGFGFRVKGSGLWQHSKEEAHLEPGLRARCWHCLCTPQSLASFVSTLGCSFPSRGSNPQAGSVSRKLIYLTLGGGNDAYFAFLCMMS